MCVLVYQLHWFHLFLSGFTPWVIDVFNLSRPHKWSSAVLHTNGSLLWEHYSFRKSEMVKLALEFFLILRLLVVNFGLFLFMCTFRYLDIAGQKDSNLYIHNGVALFLGWLVWSFMVMALALFSCGPKFCVC